MEDKSALKQLIDRDEFNFNEFIDEKTEGLVLTKEPLTTYILSSSSSI